MSTASNAHTPAASALHAKLKPSGPGNISGTMVSMVARHMTELPDLFIGAAPLGWRLLRRDHHDAAAGDVDLGHEGGSKRHHDARPAVARPQLQDIAGAEIMDRHHGPDLSAFGG